MAEDGPYTMREDGGSYLEPEHGWTCFHCGETFHTEKKAREHFGPRPTSKPACGLIERETLLELRRLEGLIALLTRYKSKA